MQQLRGGAPTPLFHPSDCRLTGVIPAACSIEPLGWTRHASPHWCGGDSFCCKEAMWTAHSVMPAMRCRSTAGKPADAPPQPPTPVTVRALQRSVCAGALLRSMGRRHRGRGAWATRAGRASHAARDRWTPWTVGCIRSNSNGFGRRSCQHHRRLRCLLIRSVVAERRSAAGRAGARAGELGGDARLDLELES